MVKKFCILLPMFILLIAVSSAAALPGFYEQLDLIADNAAMWKQDVEYGIWGYIVTDLDQNGRMEIISASVQGTGFYTYILAYEVSEDGSSLTEEDRSQYEYQSAPDIMVDKVKAWYDPESGRYLYLFTDMIRNGMAEYYESKIAVYIENGIWNEIPLAIRSTFYSDPDHFTTEIKDADGNEISETQFDTIEQEMFGSLYPADICFKWQMTDNDSFDQLSRDDLRKTLEISSTSVCPGE